MSGRLLRFLVRQGWRRGVLGDSRLFLVVGALALLGHLFRRTRSNKPDVVFSERLRPGETFRIFHEPRP